MSFNKTNNFLGLQTADSEPGGNRDLSLSCLVDVNLTDEVKKYREKLSKCLTDGDSISMEELKNKSQDLSLHRDWFVKILKYVNKLQDSVNDDFFSTVDQFESVKERLRATV